MALVSGAAGLAFLAYVGLSIAEFAKRAAVAIGFGLVTYFGVGALIFQLQTKISDQFVGLPTDVLQMLGIMQIDVAATMIISATTAKFVRQGWNKFTDTRKGTVWRKPGSSDPTILGA